jgi:hypothetical protein
MHKITRYPLLFKRLYSLLPTENSETVQLVAELIETSQNTLESLNQKIKKTENQQRLVHLSQMLDMQGILHEPFKLENSYRSIIKELSVTLIKVHSVVDHLTIVLCSDLILLVRKKSTATVLYREPIPLEEVVFLDIPFSFENKHCFLILQLQKVIYKIEVNSLHEKISFLNLAEQTRHLCCTLHQQALVDYLKTQPKEYESPMHSRSPSEESKKSQILLKNFFFSTSTLYPKLSRTSLYGDTTGSTPMAILPEEPSISPISLEELNLNDSLQNSSKTSKSISQECLKPVAKKGFLRRIASLTKLTSSKKSTEKLYSLY